MKTLDQWLELYSASHQHPTNKLIHKICVPVITFTVFGVLWCIPKFEFMEINLLCNWATLFGLLALLFYLRFSFKLFLVMLFQMIIYLFLSYLLYLNGNLLFISSVLFIIAWIGQFWGHKIEGKKPSFFEDLQFLLIGPIWVIKPLFKF